MVKEVAAVYSTKDYSKFKKLNGNREVLEKRVKLILESIKERGWIRNPIVVNEWMEIIDGQGRFEALQRLGLPVEYVIAKGATIADCISLNIRQTNWKSVDYVKCYADMGNKDYVMLLSLYGKYKNLTDTAVATIAGNCYTDGAKGGRMIRDGSFKIVDRDHLFDCLYFVDKCMGILGRGNGRSRSWVGVFKMVYYSDSIPNERFLEKMIANRGCIVPCTNFEQTIKCAEKVYNYGSRKQKVYFMQEWDAYTEKKSNRKETGGMPNGI